MSASPAYKAAFLKDALESNALKFGDFTLKSGRQSPYFFNLGLFTNAQALSTLAHAYADMIINSGIEFDVLFGPAYKGISIAALTCAKLYELGGDEYKHLEYGYNRKEKKDHGEGGSIVGASLKGRKIAIIDDVMSAGTAANEAHGIISAEGGDVVAIFLALDRQESTLANPDKSAVQLVSEKFGIPVKTIANLDDIRDILPLTEDQIKSLDEYKAKYIPK